jgi:hypothetical protein
MCLLTASLLGSYIYVIMGTPPSRKHILRVTSVTTGHGILRPQISLSSHPPCAPNHNTEIRFETYEILPVVSHRAIDAPYYCNLNPIPHQTIAKPVCPMTFTSVGSERSYRVTLILGSYVCYIMLAKFTYGTVITAELLYETN